MPDASASPDLIEIPPPSWVRRSRLVRGVAARVDRFAAYVAQMRRPRPQSGASPPGPVFAISGIHATFEELERISFDPTIMARVERVPTAALVRPDHPLLTTSGTAESLGWRRRPRPARIYEVMPFGFELDMLELRLTELHDVVDRFIVAEASRGFGGMRKPLYLQRNWPRLAPFHAQLEHVIVDTDGFDALYPGGRRERTDWIGEDALRTRLWQRARTLALEPDAVVIWTDVDELLPRWMIRMLRHYECPLPMRVHAPAFRYHFGWRDPDATAGVTVFDAGSVGQIDQRAATVRALPARTFAARGAVHLTSFLDPAVLQMKFAVTTDWEREVLRYIRNAHGETAAMMRNGRWFGRPLRPYDAEADPLALVPLSARVNRARYPLFWPGSGAATATQFE